MTGQPETLTTPEVRPSRLASAGRMFLPTTRNARLLTAASFVDAVGTGLYLAGAALFFTQVAGLTALQVGIGQSIFGLAGLLGTVPIGRLADRLGGKRIVITLYAWQAVCFSALFFVRRPLEYFILAFLIGLAEWGTSPVIRGLVGALEGAESRVRTMAVISTVRNLGFTLGGLMVAAVAVFGGTGGFAMLMLGNAASFVLAAVLLTRLALPAGALPPASVRKPPKLWARNPRFMALTGLNGVLTLNGVLITIGLPVWIATQTDAPRALVGLVLVINTIMVIALQVVLGRGTDSVLSGARAQRWAAWCLAGCCLVVAFTERGSGPVVISLIVAAAMLLTLGEIWTSIGSWRISFNLAPPEQRTYYLSVYELGRTAATTAGPVLVTWAVIENGMPGWIGLAVLFLIAGEAVAMLGRRAPAA